MDLFRGLSAFAPTPTDADGHVQTDALGRILDRIHAAGPHSIGLLGSTGGYAFLSRAERRRAVEAAASFGEGRTPVIVGVGALRTDEAQQLARDAAVAGANGLLLAPMTYTPLTEEEVFRHFVAVASATDLPLCIYNNPGTTKFTFSHELIARLANVPNIAAVKMPLPANGDFKGELAGLRAIAPKDFAIGYSGDWGAADALLAGCDAWFSVAAGLLPGPALKLTRAAHTGDTAEVQRMNDAFKPLWDLFRTYGSFRVVYVIMDLIGVSNAAPPLPILPLSAEARQRVDLALQAIYITNAD
ncbi:dihydrodipicolinate synthase family protein [Phyllobacterium salinisoli]|uniref:dihydrodipicolinate synthase family protein n=1 Tax=Phyllobacterium salinisoli TaxID=1899321 RepID=UPI001FE213D3|nr:dihydrodipicolinate synthase family protein [Phyllobacterium salinisoli]